jgi:hypothetical protein
MTINVLFESDSDAAPHSPSAPIMARVLVEKIKHCFDLDDSVCHGLFYFDNCAREFCWGNSHFFCATINFAELQKST